MDGIMADLLTAVGGIVTAVGGYLITGHNNRIKAIEATQDELDKNLSSHKLESEKRYAKEETLQSSFTRLENRIDIGLAEIRSDIKDIRDYVIGKK